MNADLTGVPLLVLRGPIAIEPCAKNLQQDPDGETENEDGEEQRSSDAGDVKAH